MKKIIELLISSPNFLDDDNQLAVDTISLVETPAIGYTWLAFQEEDEDEEYREEFESYSDYPEAAKKNAQRALNWARENGWGDCLEATGKARANQLAKGEPISEETISRMASFKRQQQHKDVPYTEGCGGIAWDAWGGDAGIEWASKKLKSIREELEDDIIIGAEEFGIEHDPETTTYINSHSFEDNPTVSGIADSIKALDILKTKKDATAELQTVYKYEGPISSNSRKFCRAMVRLSRTKFWTREDIRKMTRQGVNSELNSPIRSGNYDIFKYAGGARCHHQFIEYSYFKSEDGRVLLINRGPANEKPTNSSNEGFVNDKQREKADQWYAINANKFQKEYKFEIVEGDQQIVVAPVMVPNNLIRRLGDNNEEYYVYFSEETVKEISEKYFADDHTNSTNINHDGDNTKVNTVLESWLVEDSDLDKSNLYGFNVPKGTWMMSMKINDADTWNMIKDGKLRGYSVEGNFLELIK